MPIHSTAFNIAIATVSIRCDLCETRIEPHMEIGTTETISRIQTPDGNYLGQYLGLALFEVPGLPNTHAAGVKFALERGWCLENVHKKSLLVCPGCKAK